MINLSDFRTPDEFEEAEKLLKPIPPIDQIRLRQLITCWLARAYNEGYENALDGKPSL